MTNRISLLLLGAVAALGVSAPAAATVTFTGLSNGQNGGCSTAATYTSDGYGFVSSSAHFHVCPAAWGQTDNGTETLLADTQFITMTKVGGGLFDLFSFDAAEWADYGGSRTISVVGTYADNGTTNASFQLDNLFANGGFQTFTLSNSFRNLLSVRFSETYNLGQYDNFVTEAAVPEPAALALFGLGVAGLAARRRRKSA